MKQKPKTAVVMGSKNDMPHAEKAAAVLAKFGIESEIRVLSAHRTPDETRDFARNARDAGFSCIIACAGKAAHLAGAIAAQTTLPVIGLPLKSDALDGLDALLSTVQMPAGVPVAAVAIDGAENAGLLAAQIIGVFDAETAEKLLLYKKEMKEKVLS